MKSQILLYAVICLGVITNCDNKKPAAKPTELEVTSKPEAVAPSPIGVLKFSGMIESADSDTSIVKVKMLKFIDQGQGAPAFVENGTIRIAKKTLSADLKTQLSNLDMKKNYTISLKSRQVMGSDQKQLILLSVEN